MSFAIFDETYYLRKNPDVAAAVKAGNFTSGLQHFQLFGLGEGRTAVSPYWREQAYFGSSNLPNNFDVFQALSRKDIPSALAHFIQYGESEGRVVSDSFYNEQFYLQRYPDVANAVASGIFKSGFSHFIQFGKNERRQGSAFNEKAYLAFNPDVALAVSAGVLISGLEHYQDFGRNEFRTAFLSGSNSSDYVSAFDTGQAIITGVEIDIVTGQTPDIVAKSLGVGEIDTLIASNIGGSDRFILGIGKTATNMAPQKFYIGQGNADYAIISNLDILGGDVIVPGQDAIQLAGKPEDYVIERVSGTSKTAIYAITIAGNNRQLDLVALVDSINLSVANVDSVNETFIVKNVLIF